MPEVTEVVKIRRKVLAELARLAFAGTLEQDIKKIFDHIVTEDGVRYRCCVHKERAVLKDRINLALCQPLDSQVEQSAQQALEGLTEPLPVINILPEACDACPIDKFLVTDACRNCLAHKCINSCPKKAIVVVQNKAYIDKHKCVECGLCKRSCPYGAIIEISRPCERACELQAIQASQDRKAVIDYGKCISCGACIIACPFGAIGDSSIIVQLIQAIKAGKKLIAMVAPAFVGQFGIKLTVSQLFAAFEKIGFAAVREVAAAADLVVIEDAKEFIDTVPQQRQFMTTSCCPSFAMLIRKHVLEVADNISSVLSPMEVMAKWIKQDDEEAMTVFIGPCVAKKGEARAADSQVDFVLTFEEAAALLVGAGINLAEQDAGELQYETDSSHDGKGFAYASGVCQAVVNAVSVMEADKTVAVKHCEGVGECKKLLEEIRDGKTAVDLLEGMACVGGCVGGPGSLADYRVARKQVERFMESSSTKGSMENTQAVERSKGSHHQWHRI